MAKDYPQDTFLKQEGTFTARIEAVSDRPTKAGKQRLGIKYKIAGGACDGQAIWGAVFSPAAAGRLFKCADAQSEFFNALPSKDTAFKALNGKSVTIHVSKRGEWFNVTAVDPITKTAPGVDQSSSSSDAEVPF